VTFAGRELSVRIAIVASNVVRYSVSHGIYFDYPIEAETRF